MHPAISRSYILPAIFLNPVLFLMSLNTILSRVLPPIVDFTKYPPPYYAFGPSAPHLHLDIHASEKLCWSYTFLIVCAQLAAFASVSECREQGRLRARMRGERIEAKVRARRDTGEDFYRNGNGHAYGVDDNASETPKTEDQDDGFFGPDPGLRHLEASDEDSTKTGDSETIL